MIKNSKPLCLAEVEEILEKSMKEESGEGSKEGEKGEDGRKEIMAYIKKFRKIKLDDAKNMIKEIEKLDNIKIKPEHVVKIIDLAPEDEADISKIFTDVSLNKDESEKILGIVKQFK
jgi:DNA-directed RNA polymerase subunit F